MAEYVLYRQRKVKIGTCDHIQYASYHRLRAALLQGHLQTVTCDPAFYLQPGHDFIFRFPFPDEDHLAFGAIDPLYYDRSFPLSVAFHPALAKALGMPTTDPLFTEGQPLQLNIFGQKLVHLQSDKRLALTTVVTSGYDHQLYRIEDTTAIVHLADQIQERVLAPGEPQEQAFLAALALRITAGYLPDPLVTPDAITSTI